jgi:ATP-binding cassette subfamily C (CFTR/MRP) protein 1
MEHFRSPAPSVLVICYSFIKGIYSALALRSHHRLATAPGINASLAFSMASYLALMCVELVEKRKLLREKVCFRSESSQITTNSHTRQTLSAVTTSSFLSRSIYIWLIPLLWTGRKKTLSIDDCDIIPDEFYAQPTRLKLETALMRTRYVTPFSKLLLAHGSYTQDNLQILVHRVHESVRFSVSRPRPSTHDPPSRNFRATPPRD